jgi:hypothetical protein
MIGNEELVMEGYVYILEVKDIVLPVCKIGMTERNPWRRCAEINSGSTGDFIWEVAHYVFVDRCRELESLVHSKLAPLRQKRREFFGITADAAYTALLSILESQDAIHQLEPPEVQPTESKTQGKARRAPPTRSFRKIDTEYAAVLQLFSSELKIKGKPFGQLNTRRFGISDGNRGVQWNLAVNSETNEIRIGINLEGSANTGGWLIADFIKSNPSIRALRVQLEDPDHVFLAITRDAWQGPSRLAIREKYIGGQVFPVSAITEDTWTKVLAEALSCLDEDRDHRGRNRNQPVTLESNGRVLERDVSPHLTIWRSLQMGADIDDEICSAIAELKPVYDWVVAACHGSV